jgi:iron complex outermembrane recepter protein
MDRRLRVNPTVFFTDWTDIQVNTLIPIPEPGAPCLPASCQPGVGTAPQNKGDAEIMGLEFEALYQATDRLTLQASFGYLDADYTEVRNVSAQIFPTALGGFPFGSLFVPNLCDGKDDQTLAQLNPNRTAAELAPLVPLYECQGASEMAKAPEFKFSVGAQYAFPLSGGAQILASADYGWTDKQRSQVAEVDYVPLPSYGVVNARVQYSSPDNRWSLAVFGTNLTDELYYFGGTDYANGYTGSTTVWDPARPAEYGATVKFNF